jgi:hypothetical protein
LVAAGDVAYNGVHQWVLEGRDGGLRQWIQAIDRVAELRPRAVVAGHKNKDLRDDPAILAETREYLLDVIRLLDDKPTARDFSDQMIKLYPDRLSRSRSRAISSEGTVGSRASRSVGSALTASPMTRSRYSRASNAICSHRHPQMRLLAGVHRPPAVPGRQHRGCQLAGRAESGSQRHGLSQRPVAYWLCHHLYRRDVHSPTDNLLHLPGQGEERKQSALSCGEVNQQVHIRLWSLLATRD